MKNILLIDNSALGRATNVKRLQLISVKILIDMFYTPLGFVQYLRIFTKCYPININFLHKVTLTQFIHHCPYIQDISIEYNQRYNIL